MDEERVFTRLADHTDAARSTRDRAPADLKSRLYSALVQEMAAGGPLRDLPATKADGRALCVFENLLQIVPVAHISSMNPCRICHARLLAERFQTPPIYWSHCPYVAFGDD
jgi:hypothetical protein